MSERDDVMESLEKVAWETTKTLNGRLVAHPSGMGVLLEDGTLIRIDNIVGYQMSRELDRAFTSVRLDISDEELAKMQPSEWLAF